MLLLDWKLILPIFKLSYAQGWELIGSKIEGGPKN